MKVLNKLTIRSLKLNKKRSAVTIIGIILATALITAVAGMLTSFRATMIERDKQLTGNFHYGFRNVPADELQYIENNRNVDQYYLTSMYGYASFTESKNPDKPYFALYGFDASAFKNAPIRLVEGRMPENANEIVISQHILTNGKADYQIGDTLTLSVGKRESADGTSLNQSISYEQNGTESLTEEFTKEYTIVGMIKRPSSAFEEYSAPGYSILTYMDDTTSIASTVNIYTLYTKEGLKNRYQVTADILNVDADLIEKSLGYQMLTQQEEEALAKASYGLSSNPGLINWQMNSFSVSTMSMIRVVASTAVIIIMVTSIFCIRNSFEISITEKKRQYGMLSSVGATSRQIRRNVLYEGAVLGAIGIPSGIAVGLLAIFILLKTMQSILASFMDGVEFQFHVSLVAILIAVMLSVLTIYFSAVKAAVKAAKVSPIEAIRSNQDIRINGKKLHTPKWIRKMFGMGGDIAYKNVKRNRKKYRTTVVSIVVSVAIFIAISSFVGYAFRTSSIYYTVKNYNLACYTQQEKNNVFLKELPEMEHVEQYSVQRQMNLVVPVSDLQYSQKGNEAIEADKNWQMQLEAEQKADASDKEDVTNADNEDQPEKSTELSDTTQIDFSKREIPVISLGKEEYDRFLSKLELSYDEVGTKAILIDEYQEYSDQETGKGKYYRYQMYQYQAGDTISGTIMDSENGTGAQQELSLTLAAVTQERPMGFEGQYSLDGVLVVSDEFLDQYQKMQLSHIKVLIQSDDASGLQEEINREHPEISIYNEEESENSSRAMWLVISIFLYGFITVISLIGITSIFNTITTNMSLRSKEFAMLKSIGMTSREFNRMVRLETLFYGIKSLLIGVPAGIILSVVFYNGFSLNTQFGYQFPAMAIAIAVAAVFVLIFGIMHYSLSRINRQNIIETIRKDNI